MAVSVTFALLALLCLLPLSGQAQNSGIVLGRPTDTSVTASILLGTTTDLYIEYSTTGGGPYTKQTATTTAEANVPLEVLVSGLMGDTRYYYRLETRPPGSGPFTPSPEYTFHTQRAKGSTFTFTIEADEHLYDKKGVKDMYQITLANEAADKPDFMMTLGDIFGDDHNPFTITAGQLDSLHRAYRPFLGQLCHSVPFFICLGNHEGENDYYFNKTPPNNLCVWATEARKYYYPNPYPNGFYTGNTDNEPYGIGNPQDYYAWTWGDALFVVLDVYRHECDTSAKPHNWDWTLGLPQYTWLKNTLEGSHAKYKFVFAHHIRGQDRGGITNAQTFEWGGYETIGGRYTFDANRPGWAKPIHKLFVDNGVTVFFQGHDHLYAHEMLDSMVYQEVPMAADSTYTIGMLANAKAYTADTLDGTGHLRVTVAPSGVSVDFVRAYLPKDTLSGQHHNREVALHYVAGARPMAVSSGSNTTSAPATFTLTPQPASDRLQVTVPDGSTEARFTLRLIDALGRVALTRSGLGQGESSVEVSALASGLYLATLEGSNGSVSEQHIIIKH